MSYIPTEWKTGDVVTAEKLNKIEEALANMSGGGTLVVHTILTIDDDPDNPGDSIATWTCDKTFDEINDANSAVIIIDPNDNSIPDAPPAQKYTVINILSNGGAKWVEVIDAENSMSFKFIKNDSGYPEYSVSFTPLG